MPHADARTARCRVFTFKEGLLSAVAHDLELDVTSFELSWDESGRVDGRFDAGSLAVLHALHDGSPTSALSEKDKAKIVATVRSEVLQAARYPSISFAGTGTFGDVPTVEGTLTLVGRSRPLRAVFRREGDSWTTRVVLHQPDFGITPFSAMLGALKIKADVHVELRIPA